MRRTAALILLGIGLTGCEQPAGPGDTRLRSDQETVPMTHEHATSALDFTVQDIDGNDVDLARYRGKVVLIVNVASKCGFTPQYRELQVLHEQFAEQGLAILGFPSNDFLWQEPGTNADIKQFCTTTYGVDFDMFAKVAVKGRKQCDLYRFLTSKERHQDLGGAIRWNFTKFLLDRQGRLVARFGPRTPPDDPKVVEAVLRALRSA
jgi:glutathione peroxidase